MKTAITLQSSGSASKTSILQISQKTCLHQQLNVEENTAAKANALYELFTNVAVSLKNRAFKLRDFVWETPKAEKMATNQKFGFKYVSRIFVEKELKSLKRKSAAGWDDLPPCMLKDCARVISGPLTHLINLSLTSGTVPNDWKIAKVTPIHKSGSIDDYNNFRPISVLPVLLKILERAVHTQFIQYIESNNILSKHQFNYRKKRSTEFTTILLADNIRKEIDSGKLVGAVC